MNHRDIIIALIQWLTWGKKNQQVIFPQVKITSAVIKSWIYLVDFTGGNSLISIITIEKKSFFSIFFKNNSKRGSSQKIEKKEAVFPIVIKEFPPVKSTMENTNPNYYVY